MIVIHISKVIYRLKTIQVIILLASSPIYCTVFHKIVYEYFYGG